MGRPLKHKQGTFNKYMAIPLEDKPLWDKAAELAKREGKAVYEIVNRALAKDLELHYPGNPQPTLDSFQENGLKALTLQAHFLARGIREDTAKLLENMEDRQLQERLTRDLNTLASLNQKIRDDEVSKLIQETIKRLEETT